MSANLFIEKAVITGSKLLIYNEFIGIRSSSNYNEKSKENLENSKVQGMLSKNSKKRIEKLIKSWIECLVVKQIVNGYSDAWKQNKITFATLTLPAKQFHDDKTIKRNMLNRFNIEIKRKQNVNTNFWVAEKQDNSNIHFHILYNKFINYKSINLIWNKILNDNGYIENYRNNQLEFHKNGFQVRKDLLDKWNFDSQKKAYLKGISEDWQNPNSTDIHKLNKINNIGSYLIKYVSKGNENKKIDGKIWGCSENLNKLKILNTTIDYQLSNYINYEMHKKKNKVFTNDYCTIIENIDMKKFKEMAKNTYNDYLDVNNYNYSIIYQK